MKEVIMKVPSFSADYPKAPICVADLVRCKECKWRGEQTESGIPYYWCRLVGVGYEVPLEHYCSYGERESE